ncbi:MAG: GDP-mannose 4,6-dehydratase [Actinomycetota bacterium]
MRALITGAGGFVGPHLADHLRASGDDVVPIDVDNGPDLRDRLGWADTVAGVGPDVIYHLAGWSDVGGSWQDPFTTFEVNVMGAISVLEAARLAGTGRVVLVSSADVYGTVGAEDLPITEQHPVRPRSPYGASKEATEAAAAQYHRGHGLDVVVVRPFNHIGPGQSPRFAAPAFACQIAEAEASDSGDPVPLRHGDLSPERDLTDVRDVVRAYRLLAETGEAGQTYNVCSGRAVAMHTVLDTLLALSPAPIRPEVDPARLRPVEVPALRGSPDKLAEATGWAPGIELDQTLREVLDDARNRVGGGTEPPLPTGRPSAG